MGEWEEEVRGEEGDGRTPGRGRDIYACRSAARRPFEAASDSFVRRERSLRI